MGRARRSIRSDRTSRRHSEDRQNDKEAARAFLKFVASDDGRRTLATYGFAIPNDAPPTEVDTDSTLMEALLLSIRLSLTVSAILFAIGVPLAYWLTFSRWPGKFLIEAIVALPLVLPPTVLGFYLLVAMGSRGPLGHLWQTAFGHGLAFTFTGLVIASVLYSLPFAVQPLAASFESVDRKLLDASAVLGAGRLRTFLRVILPLSIPGVISAVVLSFRAHARRIRRRPHGRRQSRRCDTHRLHRNLRSCAIDGLRGSESNRAGPADLLVCCAVDRLRRESLLRPELKPPHLVAMAGEMSQSALSVNVHLERSQRQSPKFVLDVSLDFPTRCNDHFRRVGGRQIDTTRLHRGIAEASGRQNHNWRRDTSSMQAPKSMFAPSIATSATSFSRSRSFRI